MMRTERVRVNPDGTVVAVYTDTIDLLVVGHVRAVRASVVEWDECRQAWFARILSTGEVLGPFATRAEAVEAERAVLADRLVAASDGHAARPSVVERPRECVEPEWCVSEEALGASLGCAARRRKER
jgi:hypothetical protein